MKISQQLENYLDVRSQILTKNNYWSEETGPMWVGFLVGESISAGLQELLSNGYEYFGIPIAGMTIKRFKSEKNEVYVISDLHFKILYTLKDYSKFIFQGKEYNKGSLVNTVIKAYDERVPEITFSELKRVFPNSIQGSFGVFNLTAKVEDIYHRGQGTLHQRGGSN